MRTRLWLVVALVTALAPIGAAAQAQRTAAALVLTEGVVYLNDRQVEANSLPSVLPDAAVLRTTQGRAAIALKRGGWIFLDSASSVRVFGNSVYNFNRLEVLTGSAVVASGTSTPVVECEREIRLSDTGFFRFDVLQIDALAERFCRVRVYEGAAAVQLITVTNALRAGQAMT
ncbi:MAG TPA: hypothetical protein VGL29_08985, partial [Blastocatellia bacterium]